MQEMANSFDLDLQCVDEDIDGVQKLHYEQEVREFTATSDLIREFRQKRHLINKSNGSLILGIPNSNTLEAKAKKNRGVRSVNGGVKKRPATSAAQQSPVIWTQRSPAAQQPTINAQPSGNSAQPVRKITVVRQRFPLQVKSPTLGVSANPNSATNLSLQEVTMTPNNGQSAGQEANGIFNLPSGQQLNVNVNRSQVQSVLFDASTGLLLVNPGGLGGNTTVAMTGSNTNTNATTTSNQTGTNPIITSVQGSGTNLLIPVRRSPSGPSPRLLNPRPARPKKPSPSNVPRVSVIPLASTNPRPVRGIVGTNLRPRMVQPQPPALISKPRPSPPRGPTGAGILNRPTQLSKGPVAAAAKPQVNVVKNQPVPVTPKTSKVKVPEPPPFVDLTNKNDSKSANSNKTFPSLVVSVKPCLREFPGRAALHKARVELDQRVRALLVFGPAKMIEVLMQKGLLRLDHCCSIHKNPDGTPVAYKLGQYTDPRSAPQTGGYVWISDCCPDQQVSVFHCSIFESSPYPPSTLLKLIYHWSCQTSVANITQWVKVTPFYIKNFFTLLRSVCVAALNEFCPVMGGYQKYVEVGIVTLASTLTLPNCTEPMKVEILGAFDPTSKIIRLKVINPFQLSFNTFRGGKRCSDLILPLKKWIHKSSCILIDSSVEKSLLTELGFKTVIQCGINLDGVKTNANAPSNVNVMNYLKNIVPKMFTNTLNVLTKTLIQQFLDELSWREQWGRTSSETFEAILGHLVVMTTTNWDSGETLYSHLNKIAVNPFDVSSKIPEQPFGIDALPDSIRNTGIMTEEAPEQVDNQNQGIPATLRAVEQDSSNAYSRNTGTNQQIRPRPQDVSPQSESRKRKSIELDRSILRDYFKTAPRTISLLSYYFTTCPGITIPSESDPYSMKEFPKNLKCSMCSKSFLSSVDVLPHIFGHVTAVGRLISQKLNCDYCLKLFVNEGQLESHVNEVHFLKNAEFACVICQEFFLTLKALTLHMWEKHCKAEMPYICGICDFRSSRHPDLIDHFDQTHAGLDSLLCPFCIKLLPCSTGRCLNQILDHMSGHASASASAFKKRGRKCPHCSLIFLSDMDLQAHIYGGAHLDSEDSAILSGRSVTPVKFDDDQVILMAIPPPVAERGRFEAEQQFKRGRALGSKNDTATAEQPTSAVKPVMQAKHSVSSLNFHDFTFYYPAGQDRTEIYSCTECSQSLTSADHFPGLMICVKCEVETCCQPSMAEHNINIHPIGSGIPTKNFSCLDVHPIRTINTPARCTCGFQSIRADVFMDHVKNCLKA